MATKVSAYLKYSISLLFFLRSPRGLLSKQYSLPAAAKNPNPPRQLRGSHQRHHGSLRHDPAPQRLFDQSFRRASTRERTSSGGFGARRATTSTAEQQQRLGRTSGSFNLGTISASRSPVPTAPPRGLSVGSFSRSRNTPSPRPPMTDDEIQHI